MTGHPALCLGPQWSHGPHPMGPNGYGEASSSRMSCAAICRPKWFAITRPGWPKDAHLKLECLIFFSISNLRDNSDSQHFLNRKELLTDDWWVENLSGVVFLMLRAFFPYFSWALHSTIARPRMGMTNVGAVVLSQIPPIARSQLLMFLWLQHTGLKFCWRSCEFWSILPKV